MTKLQVLESVGNWISGRNFVVTGGAGFIGHHLVKALLDHGALSVLVIDSLEFGDEKFIPNDPRVSFIKFEIGGEDDVSILGDAIIPGSCVFHLAAQKHRAGQRNHDKVWKSNLTGTDVFIDFLGQKNISQVIFTSSLYAYGRVFDRPMQEDITPIPHTAYGISKLADEHLIKMYADRYGFAYQIARLFFVYGPEQYYGSEYSSVIHKNIGRVRKGLKPTIVGSGTQVLDYIYIEDVLRALLMMAAQNHNGLVANVSSGKGRSILDIVNLITGLMGAKLENEFLPPDWTDGTSRVGDNTKLKEICGWQPLVDFEEGLRVCLNDAENSENVSVNKDISVIVPCYNEEKNLEELVLRITKVFKKMGVDGEVILVDDCSSDSSIEKMKQLQRRYRELVFVKHAVNKGMFEAWKTGVEISRGAYACIIDADLQYMPEDIARLWNTLGQVNTDIVQGYRSSIGRIDDSRVILSKTLNFLLNTLFGMKAKDNKSGFILCDREVLAHILDLKKKYYYPQTFLRVSAEHKGYVVHEIETLFQSRKLGESFITKNPIRPVLLSFVDLAKGFSEFVLSKSKHYTSIEEDLLKKYKPTVREKELSLWRKILWALYVALFPLHTWTISRRAIYYYQILKQTQWLTREQMTELQERKLRKIIRHAYYHVPYYREIMRSSGLRPSDIQHISDLKKLPLLNKQNVRENLYFDLFADNHNKKEMLRISTSGSTGQPFVCYADKHQLEMRWAATLRSAEWTGYQFGDKQARLWHQTLGMTRKQVFKEYLNAFLSRRIFIPAFKLNDKAISAALDRIKKFKPDLIDGYAESLNLLARYISQNSVNNLPKLKGIISSAQSLPAQSREIIEKAFGCKVFDKYGSREFSGVAYESLGHDGHLVVAENYIVEIIANGNDAAPGETGEVVITDLNNFCLPFIRYRVGDLAVKVDHNYGPLCGRGLPVVGNIDGRVQAIIRGSNGVYLPGTFFAHFFKEYDHMIAQYKIIQSTLESIELQVVKSLRFDDHSFAAVLTELRSYLGNETMINVTYHDEIPMVRTGKQQGSVSLLNFDFQELRSAITNPNKSGKKK